ncbi:MAG: hypothetical protein JRG68_05320 [Deltaproteobacteria bacterium]|nr:hypothetical protein [Deltaproteobacteria bacterium]
MKFGILNLVKPVYKCRKSYAQVLRKGDVIKIKKNIRMVLFVGIFLSACGYHFEGGGDLPAGGRNVFVGVFENRTSETGLENIFTNALINEFTRSKRFAGREKADALLSGVISSMSIETISHGDSSHTSLERRVKIWVDLKLTAFDRNASENSGSRVIWIRKGMTDIETYDVDDDKLVTEQNKKEAISTLSKRLAESVYNRLTEDF